MLNNAFEILLFWDMKINLQYEFLQSNPGKIKKLFKS